MLLLTPVVALGFSTTPSTCEPERTSYLHEELGNIDVVCDLCESNPMLYLEADAAKWEGLSQVFTGFDISISVPESCPPFKHAFVSYPVGQVHPPFDGRQFNDELPGGFGQPHLDVHFMVVTEAEREALTGTCVTLAEGPQDSTGQLIQCDISSQDEHNLKFTHLPAPEYTTGFAADITFGGHSIVGHGTHLMTETDLQSGGPANCTSTGPFAELAATSDEVWPWLDCLSQFQSGAGGAFADSNCTCGFWDDGTSPVLNVFDGKVLGNEVMPTVGIVEHLRSGALANPYYESFPKAEKYDSSGYQPTQTMGALVGDKLRVGLVLSSEYTDASV